MTPNEYIESLKITQSSAYGNCEAICNVVLLLFPELTLVRGHYYCAHWGERMHWWLIDKEGAIIDPTAIQFPSNGVGVYAPWDETQKEPTGMCPQCGDYCYDGEDVHTGCFEKYKNYVMGI